MIRPWVIWPIDWPDRLKISVGRCFGGNCCFGPLGFMGGGLFEPFLPNRVTIFLVNLEKRLNELKVDL